MTEAERQAAIIARFGEMRPTSDIARILAANAIRLQKLVDSNAPPQLVESGRRSVADLLDMFPGSLEDEGE